MKPFIWMLAAAFIVACTTCWALSTLSLDSLEFTRPGGLLPAFTVRVLRPNGWILCCPGPWVGWAIVLTVRRDLNQRSVLLFAGTLTLAAAVVVCTVLVAALVPHIPLHV